MLNKRVVCLIMQPFLIKFIVSWRRFAARANVFIQYNSHHLFNIFNKHIQQLYSIQQSIIFFTSAPSLPITPLFLVLRASLSIFFTSPKSISFIFRPQNRE